MSPRHSLLLLMLALAAAPAVAAVRLTYQLNGVAVPVSWPSGAFPISYAVDRRIANGMGGSTAAIDRAFNDWQAISDASVTFKSAGVVDNARAGQDGVNSITLTNDLFADQHFIAVTTNWYDDSGHVREADIQIDPGVLAGNYNMQQVVEHEVGHLLGLDHSAALSSMMYPYVSLGGTPILDSDDKIAIATLYPRVDSGALLQGRVMGDHGGIFAAHVVAVNDNGEPVSTALTNQDGDFEMRGVPPGDYRLYAEPLDGPVDVRNLSGVWRSANVVSFPTEFAEGGTLRVEDGKVYGNLLVNSSGTIQLNPKYIGVFDPARGDLTLNATTVVMVPGQTAAVAMAGDGFVSGMTTFDVANRGVKRISDFTYAGNYVYAMFRVALDAEPGSVVVFVKSGNESAALTGGLRVAPRVRTRVVRHS